MIAICTRKWWQWRTLVSNKNYIPPTTPEAITERMNRMKSRGDDKLLNEMIDAGYFDESDKETERMLEEGKGIPVENMDKINWEDDNV